MPNDRILEATTHLRKALRALRWAHSPDVYDRLRALEDASRHAFFAANELATDHKAQLKDLRERLDHSEKIGGTNGED